MIDTKKIQIPQGSQFDRLLAIQLASLINRAIREYQEYKEYIKGNRDTNPTRNNTIIIEPEPEYGVEVANYRRLHTFYVGKDKNEPIGFIAKDQGQNGNSEIFVVFRGTASHLEWSHNLTPGSEILRDKEKVRTGFLTLYNGSIKETVEKFLNSYQFPSGTETSTQVFITGHSLGGALATLAARQILATINPNVSLYLYTFGSPRVGNNCFAEYLIAGLEGCYRIANSEDSVTYLPIPASLLFDPKSLEHSSLFRQILIKGIRRVLRTGENLLNNPIANYQHVGESISFTVQNLQSISDENPTIAGNHNFDLYRKALLP